MRCRTCDYPLWNLTARACPECGASFKPSEYEFVPRSVQFCCPHCRQAYYGTDERGHLRPSRFECVNCGKRISMDDMSMRPAEGYEEARTSPGVVPWIERRTRGRIRALFQTVLSSMFTPDRLARGLMARASTAEALIYGVGMLGVITISMAPWYRSDRLNPLWDPWLLQNLLPYDVRAVVLFALLGLGTLFGVVGLLPVWAIVAHTLLRCTGNTKDGVDRTMQAICYSAGAGLPVMVPCIGPLIGGTWCIISASIMVYVTQRVHVFRAFLAVATPPLLLSALIIGGTMSAIAWQDAQYASYRARSPDAATVQSLSGMISNYGYGNNLRGPSHAIELLSPATSGWNPWSTGGIQPFCASNSRTAPAGIPITEDFSLLDYLQLSRPEQLRATADYLEGIPSNFVAHRFGDFVFVYHGADVTTNDPQLWTVVMLPDPDVNGQPKPTTDVVIAKNDYTTKEIRFSQLAAETAKQNRYRATISLPPLPDLTTVTHDQPAIAPSTPDAEDADGDGE